MLCIREREEASPKDMCQSVAKLSWIFRPISVQDPCLVQQQMRERVA